MKLNDYGWWAGVILGFQTITPKVNIRNSKIPKGQTDSNEMILIYIKQVRLLLILG